MKRWTEEEIRALGVRTDLETAASIWGIGRTRAYELARADEFPSPVVRIGNRYVALVTPMLRALGLEGSDEDRSAASVVTPFGAPASQQQQSATPAPAKVG